MKKNRKITVINPRDKYDKLATRAAAAVSFLTTRDELENYAGCIAAAIRWGRRLSGPLPTRDKDLILARHVVNIQRKRRRKSGR